MVVGLLLLFASGELVTPPPSIGPPAYVVDFEMNGAAYHMPVPESYCVPKVTSAKLMQDVVRGALVISPQAFFLRCEKNGQSMAEHEFIYVKYLKGQKSRTASKADFIKTTVPIAEEKFDQIYDADAIADRVEKKTAADTGHQLKLSDMQAIPFGHDDACIYVGLKYSAKIEKSRETVPLFSLSCSTVADGNLVTVDISTEVKDDDVDIRDLKMQLNRVANSIALKPAN